MADPTTSILTWNFTNWVTVILMAAIGFAIVGTGVKYYQSKTQQGG